MSFAEHVMESAPAASWRLGKPGTGFYAFRVTWAPGVLAVSGDVGSGVYEVWPAFQTLAGAVDLVARAGFEYLSEKSGHRKEFDRETTVSHLIEAAYEGRRLPRARLFKQLCDHYGGDPADPIDRKDSVRKFRDDQGLTATCVYNITGDFEDPIDSYPSRARWTFEAIKLWAKEMQAVGIATEAA